MAQFTLTSTLGFPANSTLEILSLLGQTITTHTIAPHEKTRLELDLSDVPAGIYFLRLAGVGNIGKVEVLK